MKFTKEDARKELTAKLTPSVENISKWERTITENVETLWNLLGEENEIELTYTEFEILLLLAQNAGVVFSKEQIYDTVWKEPYFGDYNIVMSHIRNLCGKIEDNSSKPIYIQTVWGVGYRFNKNLSSDL